VPYIIILKKLIEVSFSRPYSTKFFFWRLLRSHPVAKLAVLISSTP
jgi:hypothetical protein